MKPFPYEYPPEAADWPEAYAYTRISDDREGRAVGVGDQRTDIHRKSLSLRWRIVGLFEDNDITADPKKKPRPDFDELMTAMASGKVKRVVCYDQDRLVRDMRQLEDIVDVVTDTGVLLTSVNGDIDLTTDNGRMVARIKGSVAKGELEKLRRRVKDRMRHNAERGIKKQGRYRTYGYNRDMTVKPDEAAVVKEAFKRRVTGESLTTIGHDFTERGLRTTGGGIWDASAVSKMIQRRDYIGEVTYEGQVVAEDAIEPIVDKALWLAANEEVEKNNNRGRGARVSLLSGFLICGNCLTKMKQGKNADGYNYRCPSPRQTPKACGSCAIGGADTDLAVFNAAWKKEQQGEPTAPEAPVRDYKAEQDAIEAEIAQTHELRQSGALALVDAVPILNDLRAKLAKSQREEAADVTVDLGVMQTFMDWDNWDLSQKRVWLDKYIKYVTVDKAERVGIKGFKPERLEIHYTDGTSERLRPRTAKVTWRFENGEMTEVPLVKPKPLCSEGDGKPVEAKGLCNAHYKAMRRRITKEQAKR